MPRRRALTLIELLVVLTIIAALLGLMLPAVLWTRAAANRAACANNLRQIGLACHAHHDAVGAFPPGYHACGSTDPLATSPGWGWAAYLLPYLEQDDLARTILYHRPIEDSVNAAARRTAVPVYRCPADAGVPASFRITDAAGRLVAEAAPCGYAATYGSCELDEVPGPREGVFYRNSHIRLTDITDGTSTTILIGDRAWMYAMAPWAGAVSTGLVRGGPRNAWRDRPDAVYPAPNFPCIQTNTINDTSDPDGALDDFISGHTGGVNLLFADGGVRFIPKSIQPDVFRAMGTRAGGEVVDLGGY
jgi:prepilin-type N-terminal cleavage/methylation domain-containing protein/prepilin-type processing-associated H-X9-DG protein